MSNRTDRTHPSLARLIRGSSRLSAWLPLLTAELLLLAAFFGLSLETSRRSRARLLAETHASLREVATREAELIAQRGWEITAFCELLRGAQQDVLADLRHGVPVKEDDPASYGVAPNGVFYKQRDDGGASLFYSVTTEIGPAQRRKALGSAAFDPLMRRLVKPGGLVSAAYLNTWDGMCRYYPRIENILEVFPTVLRMEDFVFYSAATPGNNPGGGPVWTNAYLDPAGQGWMLSCVAPVLVDGFLEGVTGLDVTLERLVSGLLDLERPFGALAMLASEDGRSLAMPDTLARLLGHPSPVPDTLALPLLGTVEYAGQVDLLEPAGEDGGLMRAAWEAQGATRQGRIGKREFLVSTAPVPGMNLRLVSFVDAAELLAPIAEQARLGRLGGFWLIGLMVLLNLGFWVWISRRSEAVAQRIAQPVVELTAATSRFTEQLEKTHLPPSRILELEQLRSNFQRMLRLRIEDHTQITRLNLSYSRFVPRAFIAKLGHASVVDSRIGDHALQEATVLLIGLAPVVGSESEGTLRERLAATNALVGRIGPAIRRAGGFVERVRGRGVRALFDQPQGAYAACSDLLCGSGPGVDDERGFFSGELTLSMHHGLLLLGTVGEEGRMDSLVLGDVVALAQGLLGLGRRFGTRLLVTERALVAGALPGCGSRRVDRVRLAGSDSPPVDVHQVFPLDEARRLLATTAVRFEAALEAWRAGGFSEAHEEFRACLEAAPEDGVARDYVARCESRLAAGAPPADWDGVTELHEDRRVSERQAG